MKLDDSFTKPGSVPFKWEIRPGVPKLQNPRKPEGHYNSSNIQHEQSPLNIHTNLSPQTSPKLKPPPAAFYFQPHPEPRAHSFRWAPNTPSRRVFMSVLARGPDIVSSGRCFLSPLLRRKRVKKGKNPVARLEPEYSSDLEISSSRWSVSSRRSVSPMSYSFPSDQLSPYQVSDAEWAALTLF